MSTSTAAGQGAIAAITQGEPPEANSQTLFTVKGLAKVEPALPVGGIRDDLFHRHNNGLAESGAVIRRGRRILLHRDRYLAWLMTRRPVTPASARAAPPPTPAPASDPTPPGRATGRRSARRGAA
jgi:hypothetical protein